MRTHSPPALDGAGRILGLDLARALALLGMIATHTMMLSDDSGPRPLALVAGKAAALFAVLAGFSITLATRRYPRHSTAALALVLRGLVIAMVGLILGSFSQHVVIILVNYGVMFMLAGLVFRLPTRTLAVLTPLWLLVVPVIGFWIRATFDLDRMSAIPGLHNFWDLAYLTSALTLTGYYPILQWFGYILVGLLLARLDWTRMRTWCRCAVVGALASAAAYGTSRLLLANGGMAAISSSAAGKTPHEWGSLEATLHTGSQGVVPTDTWWWLVVAGPHTTTPFDLVHTAGIAVVAIAGCVALCHWLRERAKWLLPLLAAGSMPLTLYTAHVLLMLAVESFLIHALALIIFATVWKLMVRRPGPLEWALSKVRPRTTQPDKKNPPRAPRGGLIRPATGASGDGGI